MRQPHKNGVKNSPRRIAAITTGLECLSLIIPNEYVKRIMVVISPGISYCSFIAIRYFYKRYINKTMVLLLHKYINEAEEECRNIETPSNRKEELRRNIITYKQEIIQLEKDRIMVEFN